jgi:hypothetical protein
MTSNEESPLLQEECAQLPDEAVVVRGGLSARETLLKNALQHHDDPAKGGDFAISAWSLPAKSGDDLARIGRIPSPQDS